MQLKKMYHFLVLAVVCFFLAPSQVSAAQKLGVHILHPGELSEAKELLSGSEGLGDDDWQYVTVPFALSDLEKPGEWKTFFEQAKKLKIIPLVRLVSRFEGESWQIPTRFEIVRQLDFLASFEWPSDERYIMVFNEVNRASEWGGSVDAQSYGQVLEFTARWAQTQTPAFGVLPAGMDLAAPTNKDSTDAFVFWEQLAESNPEVFELIDGWNTHGYPNPAFSAPPTYPGRDGVTGFRQEIAFVDELVETDIEALPIFITETGWKLNRLTRRHLENYYRYALMHVWADSNIKAVTPFVLRGDPGPFSEFSFIDKDGDQTLIYDAYQTVIDSYQE